MIDPGNGGRLGFMHGKQLIGPFWIHAIAQFIGVNLAYLQTRLYSSGRQFYSQSFHGYKIGRRRGNKFA
jgi:hypothetical protein